MKIVISLILLSISFASHALPKLLHNVKGYSINNGELVTFNSILFEADTILAIGNKQDIAKKASFSLSIDGKGKILLPGLIDSHGHLLGLGNNLQLIDLRNIASVEASIEKVTGYTKNNPQKHWILGRGWNQVLWQPQEFPSKKDLDKVTKDRPIWLRRIDGHAGWANSKALELAGISSKTPDPKGGKILKNKKGEPTGILIDTAMDLLEDKIPPQSQLEIENSLQIAFEHLLSLGITSVHDAGIDFNTYKALLNLSDKKQLPIRVYGMLSGGDKNLSTMLKLGKVDQPFLKIQSVKLYSDGALGSRGAALIEPYSDDADNTGLLFKSDKELQSIFDTISSYDFQINVHAIGDKANKQVLNAFAQLHKKSSIKNKRHRIEHAQVVSVGDIPKFSQLGIIASMQPTHATSDMNMAEDRVGSERIKGAYAWRRMLENNVLIASGSDFPVELANPFHGLFSAIKRQDHEGKPQNGWYSEQALTPAEALTSFTINGAYASFWEKQIGSLEAGKKADFILVDKDIFSKDVKDIWQTKALETWVNGVQIFITSE